MFPDKIVVTLAGGDWNPIDRALMRPHGQLDAAPGIRVRMPEDVASGRGGNKLIDVADESRPRQRSLE
jgi:hypothetical protein